MNRSSRIFVAGGSTLLGAALLERLRADGYDHLVGVGPSEPDLTAAGQVEDFFGEYRPEDVFMAAGRSGGIGLNRARPAELMLDNLLMTAHVLDASHRHGVRKLVYLASSCSYPRQAPQPLSVESLMTAPLEPTNAAYAMAKLAGWQLCSAYRQQYGDCFITAIPANAFGPHDDFSAEGGHVIPALMRRAHEAKCQDATQRRAAGFIPADRTAGINPAARPDTAGINPAARPDTAGINPAARLSVWGSGSPRREFLYSRDLADACLFVMRHYDGVEPINLGGGDCLSIAEVARAVAEVVGYRGSLFFDDSQPDGMPLKMLDASVLASLGWRPATDFRTALSETYTWFLQHEVKEDREHVPAFVPGPVSHKTAGGRGRPRLSL